MLARSRDKTRSGPRWDSVAAFLVIAFLLAVNALAMFVNAAAKEVGGTVMHLDADTEAARAAIAAQSASATKRVWRAVSDMPWRASAPPAGTPFSSSSCPACLSSSSDGWEELAAALQTETVSGPRPPRGADEPGRGAAI